jgi:hypothetical protein
VQNSPQPTRSTMCCSGARKQVESEPMARDREA